MARNYKTDSNSEERHEKELSGQVESYLRLENTQLGDMNKIQSEIDYLHNQILCREREIDDHQKCMTSDSDLMQELLDHLATKEDYNLLLLQYTAAEASQMKVSI